MGKTFEKVSSSESPDARMLTEKQMCCEKAFRGLGGTETKSLIGVRKKKNET